MAPHSGTLAWKIPWMEEPGRLQSMGSLRVGRGWATSLSLFTFMYWRRIWQPTPVFLPGESQGRGSLVGCRLWGGTESDTTEATQQQQQQQQHEEHKNNWMDKIPVLQSGRPQTCVCERERQRQRYWERDGKTARQRMKESVLQKMKQYKNKQVSIFPSKRKEPLLRTPGPEIKDLGAEVPKLFGIRDQFHGR